MKTFSMKPGEERLDTIPCPLCSTPEFRPLWSGAIPFVRCRGCGLVYQNPQPEPGDLQLRYDQEYYQYERENEKIFFSLMLAGLRDIGFDQLSRNRANGFMDIGCATGMLLEHMQARGFDEQGVEICAPAAQYGIETRGVRIHIGTLEEGGFADASFGIVHCSHLIEHLNDPAAFAAEVYRILAPGGLFLVTTPDILGFQSLIFGEKWRSAIHDHMVLFSRRTLRRLLRAAGFSVIRRRSWGGLARGSAPAVLKGPADRLCKWTNQGDVMIMAAEKPA